MRVIGSEHSPAWAIPFDLRRFRKNVEQVGPATRKNVRDKKEDLGAHTGYGKEAIEFRLPQSSALLDSIVWAEIDSSLDVKPIEFTHPCEKCFADMLDARRVQWRYKPRTFAVEWDQEGNFVDSFTPDFYLPADDLYVALIPRGAGLANATTRKVRLLREQHPEVRIELFFSQDSPKLAEIGQAR